MDNDLSPAIARDKLIQTLKNAYSGVLGVLNAYTGQRKSVSDSSEKRIIYRIELEEIYHRERVGEILSILGEAPFVHQDRAMGWVGKTLGVLCSLSGWFAPMYGAGLLESRKIKEYEEAAEYARAAGHIEFLDDLLTMAEVEWEHEKFSEKNAALISCITGFQNGKFLLPKKTYAHLLHISNIRKAS